MKLIKKASGKNILRISKTEWEKIGIDQGWINKEAGKTERGKRDGTGPFEGSAQKSISDKGKRRSRGEECPVKEEKKKKLEKEKKEKD